ncbi:MAG TPA: hypothetical protein VNC50_21870, partial [Planctomycetia bacterium]|nr:hypothetical protein [Planctomycetia bacterium]
MFRFFLTSGLFAAAMLGSLPLSAQDSKKSAPPAVDVVKLERDVVAAEKALGTEHPDTVKQRGVWAQALLGVGKKAEAAAALTKNAAAIEKIRGAEHVELGRVLAQISLILAERGEKAKAGLFGRRALAILEKEKGADDVKLVAALKKSQGLPA